jgi:hypothetical protein
MQNVSRYIMKKLPLTILLLLNFFLYGQKLKEMKPIKFNKVETNFSDEYVKKYNSDESLKACEKIWSTKSYKDYTDEDKEILKYCDELAPNPWSKKFQGCSWYCGGKVDTVNSNIPHELTKNLHDGDYGTCWIADTISRVNWIEYVFHPISSRVEDIIIVNGYVRNDDLFKTYSRIKKLKMYINNKPIAYLNLEDTNEEQVFRFKPIGHKKDKNYKPLKNTKWSIKFEIIEIYNGKNEKIALTEICFDGDGHE